MFEDILQETPAYQRILEKGREEGREEIMQEQRQELLNVILDRFPALLRLAQHQMVAIDDPTLLLRLLVKISTAPSIEAAKALLLAPSEGQEPG